jgi:hypothetical protein
MLVLIIIFRDGKGPFSAYNYLIMAPFVSGKWRPGIILGQNRYLIYISFFIWNDLGHQNALTKRDLSG